MSVFLPASRLLGSSVLISAMLFLMACQSTAGKNALILPTVEERALTGDLKVKEFLENRVSSSGFVYEVGDTVDIEVFNEAALSGSYQVDSFGRASFPYIGAIKVAGMNELQVQKNLNHQYLNGYFQKPNILVKSLEKDHGYVVVDGAVDKPGIVEMAKIMRLSEVIARVGGLAENGDDENVFVLRENEGEKDIYRVNISEVRLAQATDPVLLPTDIVIVKEEGEKFEYDDLLRTVPLANLALIALTRF